MQQQSETTGEITKALVKLQAELSPVKRQSENPFLGKKYADLATCWEAARDPLSKNGLAVVQTTEPGEDGSLVVITTLAHISGEWYRGYLPVRPVKQDPQALGSAITYGRRYSFAAIIGLAPEDDDAESAMARQQQGQQKQTPPPPQQQRPQQAKSPDHPPSSEPAPVTDAQLKKLNVQLNELVGDDRNLKLESVNQWLKDNGIEKTITTSKQLTKQEAMNLISTLADQIKAAKTKNKPQTRQPITEMDDCPF